jgi:hypothetical protein
MWSALPKPQKRIVISWYSPCADTPSAATAPVTTVDIALLIFLLHLAIHGCSDTPHVVTATVLAGGVLVHGLYLEVTIRL